jgi:hypothetical protein
MSEMNKIQLRTSYISATYVNVIAPASIWFKKVCGPEYFAVSVASAVFIASNLM